jgi:hypothetical protein
MSSGANKKKRKPEVAALLKGVKDKKSRAAVLASEDRHDRAVAARDRAADMLLLEGAGALEAEGMERTFRFKQADIKAAVDVSAAKSAFDLSLPTYGPYNCSYSRSGRWEGAWGVGGKAAEGMEAGVSARWVVRAVSFATGLLPFSNACFALVCVVKAGCTEV